MGLLANVLRKIMPEDKELGCGYGPFKLDPQHPFTPACLLHDNDYGLAADGVPEKTLNQVDWELFHRWAMIAGASESYEERCRLAMQICKMWPLARVAGPLLWNGDPKDPQRKE